MSPGEDPGRHEYSYLSCPLSEQHSIQGIRESCFISYHAIVCEQNIDEMKRVFYRKFPARIEALDRFLAAALLVLDVVPVPDEEDSKEGLIRDCLDRPILRAAIQADVDILLTGDKDFLESGIRAPKIMTPAQFMNL